MPLELNRRSMKAKMPCHTKSGEADSRRGPDGHQGLLLLLVSKLSW